MSGHTHAAGSAAPAAAKTYCGPRVRSVSPETGDARAAFAVSQDGAITLFR